MARVEPTALADHRSGYGMVIVMPVSLTKPLGAGGSGMFVKLANLTIIGAITGDYKPAWS